MLGFEKLEVWKGCRKLRIMVSTMAKQFPKSEEYGLKSQIKNAARSSTANIAEGYGRYHWQEYIQFCRISRGSVMEVKDHLIAALDDEYIKEDIFNEASEQVEKCIRLINGFIAYLEKMKENYKK